MDLGGIVNPTAFKSFVYDPQRDAIHFTTADGKLLTWSVAQKAYTGSIDIGGTPDAIDISADGAFVLIGNTAPIETTPQGATDRTYADQITRVHLGSGAIQQFRFATTAYETGISDIAIAADNRALVTTDFAGSGWNPFRTFQADAANPVFAPVAGLTSVRQSSYLLVSDNRQHILIQEDNISNGPLHIYSAATDRVTFSNDLYNLGTSGFNSGTGDYNEARSLVVDVTYNNIFVLSSGLQKVTDLTSFQSAGKIRNAAFDVDGAHLFMWDGSANRMLVIDTLSWTQVGSFNVQSGGAGSVHAPGGEMDLISDGKVLLLGTSTGVELVDLTLNLKLTLAGDAANDTLNGAIGADTIVGGGGADILFGAGGNDSLGGGDGNDRLTGGAGADRMAGGAGGDLFVFAAGDSGVTAGSLDVVWDWDAGDTLAFANGAATAGAYVETTAASYSEALSLADAQIASGAADFVVVQIGADLVVFADSRGDNGGADDAVVLAGRTLADISASALIAGGAGPTTPTDPTPNPPASGGQTQTGGSQAEAFYGGDGNDVIDAGGGADFLAGGLGDDSLSGGDGNDELQGAAGNDTLSGGAGDDLLQPFAGNDLIDGGAGTDTASFLNAATGVVVDLNLTGPQAIEGADTLRNIENLTGSLYADRLIGDAGANLLWGVSGDDTLEGRGGNDTLDGRDGADSLVGGDGDDRLEGGAGRDVMLLGDGKDTIWVGPGTSGLDEAGLDVVQDWTSDDRLTFGYATGEYAELSASSYGAGLTAANAAIAAGARYVAVQVGGDVVVFADSNANGGSAEDAVLLRGKTLADISVSNLGSLTQVATLPAPPPPPSPPPTSGGGGGGGGLPTPELRGSIGDDIMRLGEGPRSYDGGAGDDWVQGGSGDNLILGGEGNDTVLGGGGSDTLVGGDGANYLRGEEGDDQLQGGAGFDDINGNVGRDTIMGGAGDDWVVGGKDDDIIFGEQGADIVYGNLGDDNLGGGVGNDIIRGGQGNDKVRGDEGDDYVSGDRGTDTMTGGLGADVFHTFSEAGYDYVTDFNFADGDRVMVDPGTVYTVSQVGADVVIDMGHDNTMVLASVQLSSLGAGWIFGA